MSMMESQHTGMLQYSQINHARTKAKIMTEKRPIWMTLSQAAQQPECKVSRQTLHAMIERGEIPRTALEERPYGSRTITYIDKHILSKLPYRQPGQRGKAKDYD